MQTLVRPLHARIRGELVLEDGRLWQRIDGRLVPLVAGGGTFSDLVANSWLDAVARNVTYAEAAFWGKLHLGDPGSAGTSNAAAEVTRQQFTFGSSAASRAISNTTATEWTNVSNTETVTWLSFWDASTAGNFLGRDDLSSSAALTAGDTLRVPIGDLDLTIV